jgi:circadian clock protein KaiC
MNDLPMARLSTGVPGLDEILGGGLPEGQLYVVEGDPGSGKTTFSLQFLMAGAKAGERVLYVTLAETSAEIDQVARSHGWSLQGIEVFELGPARPGKPEAERQYTVFHPSEVELGETLRLLYAEVDRLRPQRLVLDSLSELQLLSRDPLRYRREILNLKQHFRQCACTVLLLDDRAAEARDLQVQSIAHGVIQMEHLARDYGFDRRRLNILKLRAVRYRGGHHDYRIETGGVVVFPRLVASEFEKEFPTEQLSSEIPELDLLLGGGLPRGSSTLITGPAGVGKSTLALRYVWSALRRGETASMYVFDEGIRTLRTRSTGLGMDLAPWIASGTLQLQQIDAAELPPGELVARMKDAVLRQGSRVVVIDSLNGYLQSMPEEKHLTMQMHELLTFLNQQGVVTILILVQSGIVGSMSSPVDVSYLADAILLLRHFEAGGELRQAVSVVKKRSGHHERSIRELRLEPGRIRVGEPLRGFQGILTGVPSAVAEPTLPRDPP